MTNHDSAQELTNGHSGPAQAMSAAFTEHSSVRPRPGVPSRSFIQDGRLYGFSPLDGKPLPPIEISTPEDVRRAVSRARLAHERWAATPLETRIDRLTQAAKAMLRRRHEAIDVVRDEIGKPTVDALFTEALGPLDAVSGWAKIVRRGTKRRAVRLNPISFPGKRAEISKVPRGVVGVVAPWNFPIAGLYRALLPALMTGNGVVLKPSEYSPRSSAWFVDRLAEFLPEGLVSAVHGDGATGATLLGAGIDACVFTGSVGTGRKVAVRCAELGIPSSLEMGGKDAAIVLSDCDLPRTVAGITHWALANAGQSCGALEVVYVDAPIADRFVSNLASTWSRLTIERADAAKTKVDVGPLAHAAQFELVTRHLEDALLKGARRVCGADPSPSSLLVPPTLLDGCTAEMDVVRDETFGPVLAVVRVDGASEAIRQINAGRYGLGVSIWTQDLARARRLAERLEVGVVDVNNHSFTGAIADLPWTGTRETGFGVANSEYSLPTFVRPKALVVDHSKNPDPFWMPYDETLWELGDLLADLQVGKRLLSAWKLPGLLRRRIRTVQSFFR